MDSVVETTQNFGLNSSVLFIQAGVVLLWIGLVIWTILKVLKKTKGTESVVWSIFIVLVPVIGIPVSLIHFKNKTVIIQ